MIKPFTFWETWADRNSSSQAKKSSRKNSQQPLKILELEWRNILFQKSC